MRVMSFWVNLSCFLPAQGREGSCSAGCQESCKCQPEPCTPAPWWIYGYMGYGGVPFPARRCINVSWYVEKQWNAQVLGFLLLLERNKDLARLGSPICGVCPFSPEPGGAASCRAEIQPSFPASGCLRRCRWCHSKPWVIKADSTENLLLLASLFWNPRMLTGMFCSDWDLSRLSLWIALFFAHFVSLGAGEV